MLGSHFFEDSISASQISHLSFWKIYFSNTGEAAFAFSAAAAANFFNFSSLIFLTEANRTMNNNSVLRALNQQVFL
jgi:hypothetical protein